MIKEQRKGLNAGSTAHVQLGRVHDELSFVRYREAYLQQEVAKMQARLDTTFKELEAIRSTVPGQADAQAESRRRYGNTGYAVRLRCYRRDAAYGGLECHDRSG